MEKTFLMVKPDGVARGLVGEVISRVERKGLKLAAMKLIQVDDQLAGKHYEEHKGKPFFPGLVSFITSSPAVAMVVEGKDAVSVIRKLNGDTNPISAPFGSIRGDYGLDIGRNVVHASDSIETAKREISLYFKPEEIHDYQRTEEDWLYE